MYTLLLLLHTEFTYKYVKEDIELHENLSELLSEVGIVQALQICSQMDTQIAFAVKCIGATCVLRAPGRNTGFRPWR